MIEGNVMHAVLMLLLLAATDMERKIAVKNDYNDDTTKEGMRQKKFYSKMIIMMTQQKKDMRLMVGWEHSFEFILPLLYSLLEDMQVYACRRLNNQIRKLVEIKLLAIYKYII